MANKSLGTLTLDLIARTAGFVQGMDAAERKSAKWRKSVKKNLADVGAAAKTGLTVIAGAAIAGGTALTAMVVHSAAAAREIKNLSAVANTNAKDFQTAAYGASIYGIEQEKLADILKDTQDKIGDFIQTGGGPLADFFDNIAPKVGVTAEQFRKLSGRDSLQLYVNSLERANLSQSDMTFYMEAIASDSARLIPLLTQNGKLFNELGKQAENAGIILSDMDFAALEGAQKTLDRLNLQWDGLTKIMAIEAAPVLDGIVTLFLDLAKESGGAKSVIRETMDGIVYGAGFAADAVDGVRRTFAVAGRFVAIFGLSAQDVMLTLAKTIIDFPTAATNGLIQLLNSIPLLNLNIAQFGQGDLSKSIEKEIQSARHAVKFGWDDINDIFMEPLPSESIDQYVERAREAASEVESAVDEMNSRTIAKADDFWSKWLAGAKNTLSNFDALSKTVVDSFTSSFGDAFEAMILDSQSLDEALRGIAETMIRSVVNAIGQMIAQWIAAAAVQAVIGTSSTAATVAQAGVAGAAWAPAAALASLATLGSNSIPAAAALTSTTALSSTLALTGMAHDGIDSVPQTGTWLLQKGERVMTSQTSDKLDRKLNNMGGGSVVNIYNAPAGTTTNQRTDDIGRTITDVILGDISAGGPIISGITGATGTRRHGR